MKKQGVRHGRAYWVRLVARWEGSGKSQQAVAEAAGVNVYTFRYWVAKLKAESDRAKVERKPPKFVEVRGAALPQSTATCRVRVGNEVVLEMSSLPPAVWIRELSESQ